MKDVSISGLVEIDEQNIKNFQEKYPSQRVYRSFSDMQEITEIDAIVVATPATSHFEIINEILKLSDVAILCEKPFTTNIGEAIKIAKQVDQKNQLLMVAHTFLFNDAVKYLKNIVDSGVLGELYYFKSRRSHLGLIRGDVNVMWDLAPHEISIIQYLLNESPEKIHSMSSSAHSKNKEDIVFVQAKYPSGVIADMHFSWLDANKERTFEIVGSKARVIFDDLNIQEPIKIFYKGVDSSNPEVGDMNFGEFKYIFRDGDILCPNINISEPLKNLCNEFIDCINNRSKPYSDAWFGVEVVKTLSSINESLGR